VDEIFSLFSDHPGEAWRMLGRLRRRAEGNVAAAPKPSGVNAWEGEVGWDWDGFTGDELSLLTTTEHAVVHMQEVQPQAQQQQQQQQQQKQQQTLQELQEEFDWKEWDQVFGRFVEVEDQHASPEVAWSLMDTE
jgi:hypothetical protein